MRISDWSSDVCSSDLPQGSGLVGACDFRHLLSCLSPNGGFENPIENLAHRSTRVGKPLVDHKHAACPPDVNSRRSEEHTSELQSLMSISYAVFCLKKKKYTYSSN